MNRANLISTRAQVSSGPVSHATPAASPRDAASRPSSDNVTGAVVADLSPFALMDPVPATPADRATVHTLAEAHRTARRLHVQLWRVTEADVHLTPGSCTEEYIAWLTIPANMAGVIEQNRTRMQRLTTPSTEHDLSQRVVRLEAALRSLKRTATVWGAHENHVLRSAANTVLIVAADALGEEVAP